MNRIRSRHPTSILLSLAFSLSDQSVSGFWIPSSDAGTLWSVRAGGHNPIENHVIVDKQKCFRSSIPVVMAKPLTSDSGDGDGDGIVSDSVLSNGTISKAPSLNGKTVLPVKVAAAGLKGHRVAAVYAILNSSYKRGSGEGWEHVMHISITRDLASDISYFLSNKGPDAVAHVRALSFSYPQKATMEDFANGWRQKASEARGGFIETEQWGKYNTSPMLDIETNTKDNNAMNSVDYDGDNDDDDDDDDMDEDDLDDYLQMMAESRAAVSSSFPSAVAAISPPLFVDNTGLTGIISLKNMNESSDIISPFETTPNFNTVTPRVHDEEPLDLGIENVDKVLDEVRPYLISDGGNVSVQRVDSDTGNVYLLLEGACGSCASSTVTMKMGIERVLKEKFGDRLGEVIQVEPQQGAGDEPSGLTIEAVQAEVNRMSLAITAMGGVVRVISVDPIGLVEIEFRGPNRVKKGLELALLDVEYVKHVKFVS